jgi:hypothetical protein
VDSEKKYQLTRWNLVYHPKDQGELGIHDLEAKKIALLFFKLLTEHGVW